MKQLLIIAALLCSSMLFAAEFEEGKHYKIVSENASKAAEVQEFFSYFCPHCFNFEPVVANLKPTLPDGVPFKKVPVGFMGQQMGPELQRAFASAQLLNIEDKITAALFQQIHVNRKAPANREQLQQVFEAQGVSADTFNSTINSMPVMAAVSEFDQQREKLNITSVPSFVVNGRYLVNVSSLKSQEEFNALINFLLNDASAPSGSNH